MYTLVLPGQQGQHHYTKGQKGLKWGSICSNSTLARIEGKTGMKWKKISCATDSFVTSFLYALSELPAESDSSKFLKPDPSFSPRAILPSDWGLALVALTQGEWDNLC